jgi:hypothetical protein
MPQVMQYQTRFGGKPYLMRVRVGKDGVFRSAIPEWAVAALGISEVTAPTLEECQSEWKALWRQYNQMLTTERKVIRYQFILQDREEMYTDPDSRDDMSFGCGKGVQIGVGNCWEMVHRDANGQELNRSYSWKNAAGEECRQPYGKAYQFAHFCSSGVLDRGKTLEWTQQREDWFVSVCRLMDVLVARLRQLDENEEALLTASANGRLRLEAPK